MTVANHRTLIPSARRLMHSLRDIGYDLPAAVADLVDNSIDAQATNVGIRIGRQGADSFIRVADDGIGMTARELDEAMRYGSDRTYTGRALGRFGLGLKTASLSQCRRLTVATRTTRRGRIEIRRWDLDDVAHHDTWRLERRTPRECEPELLDPLTGTSGTVVMWESLDRVLGYRRPNGTAAMAALEAAADRITEHLEMVFHRFLAGQARHRRRVRIRVDDTALTAWDPFARSEPRTQALQRQTIRLAHEGRTHAVLVRPYVLPAQIQFTSPEAHIRAAGPGRWNRQQGLYIYRADRLIQSGGWNRVRTMDEHSKLARIAVDVPPGADAAFGVNVSKMRVTLPSDVRRELAAIASGVVARAQDAYRQRVRLVSPEPTSPPMPELSGTQRDGWNLADDWGIIVAVLERELEAHPELLHRVLIALANADDGSTGAAGSAQRGG
jgi:hypothetical protein